MRKVIAIIFILGIYLLLPSCKSGPFNLLKPGSPHEQYQRKLINAGLNNTAMGTAWINNAEKSLQSAVPISLPYQEKGYFAPDQTTAASFKFRLNRGEKIKVAITKQSAQNFMLYLDIWEVGEGTDVKLLASADTLGNAVELDAERTANYILRLQPELLGSGSYQLAITVGPSLAYPLKSANRNQIQSLYGVGRDENTRKHEGIDIFSSFRTPVLAVADGTITGVNTNNLGGKVVWFRPNGKNFTLYYAHLDEQTVTEGQQVALGDTLGRMGNTGNAKTTPPHLHFGIYTSSGAIDPLPFINPQVISLPKINSSINLLNATARTTGNTMVDGISLKSATVLTVNAASGNEYRVKLPNGKIGFVPSNKVTSTATSLTKYKVKMVSQPLFDAPDSLAIVKSTLKNGEIVSVLGNFAGYQLVVDEKNQTGWIK